MAIYQDLPTVNIYYILSLCHLHLPTDVYTWAYVHIYVYMYAKVHIQVQILLFWITWELVANLITLNPENIPAYTFHEGY